ncbi:MULTISPECIES: energy-coupling factor transporter transmembrane component T [unclassified Enterococcus]|uniref:energy-coupling factor transporter transmembrane component T n=1 Tax=unclassified Enterococcus TaxID=2608891 RepID=UPI0015524B88|nr:MULTISPECIES: energy-coupling factor transporter transmembrane component T [unclassified Enterococcus]MBS7577546.1 energy-coupling factor transporter transmembrane protein EcfT [Enterococcus sp. MMGLQ5-2]MBS7584955.1 energy-coupling factor transporter transmembrane protein EcfT [Enterococcus sp. MMGLQ5-1]NPD12810.1 energy-coupling factor transporter transmembrane protein EcfT [Enterococcus sp. MMGLQ5-1]NPD37379.1 energy-coupling factor transporter transmembrane protein EcfT [Enterococcus sp.
MIAMQSMKTGLVLDPRTKIITLIFVGIISISGAYDGLKFFPRLAISLLPVVLLFLSRRFKLASIFTALLILSGFMEGYLNQNIHGNLNLLFTVFSGLISRFLPALIMGYYFLKTTGVEELIAAMQKAHVPNIFTIPIAVMFRFFPTIAQESSSIKDAMRLRGISAGIALKNPIRFLEFRFVPLMSSIVKIGDELSAASLTRGLDIHGKRTNYYQVKLGLTDLLWLLLVLTLVGLYQLAS